MAEYGRENYTDYLSRTNSPSNSSTFQSWMGNRDMNRAGQYLQSNATQNTSYIPAVQSPVIGDSISDAQFNAADASFNGLTTVTGTGVAKDFADPAAGGKSIFDVNGQGGSVFSNTAQGLGSLYGIYATHQGLGAAKDALNFEKQKYADLKALQAKSDANKEKFGLALQSASRANGLVK